jgi:hypothetical protein
LDQVEARRAEERRAEVEGRSPDYENPPAYAGIPLNTAGQQQFTVGVNNNPSQENRNFTDSDVQFEGAVSSKDNLLQPASHRAVLEDAGAGPVFGVASTVSDLNPAAIAVGDQADGKHTAGKAAGQKAVKTATAAKKTAPARKSKTTTSSTSAEDSEAKDKPGAKAAKATTSRRRK